MIKGENEALKWEEGSWGGIIFRGFKEVTIKGEKYFILPVHPKIEKQIKREWVLTVTDKATYEQIRDHQALVPIYIPTYRTVFVVGEFGSMRCHDVTIGFVYHPKRRRPCLSSQKSD